MAYSSPPTMTPVIHADEATRSQFLVRVYQHLGLAILAFIGFETILYRSGIAESIGLFLAGTGGVAWLLILGGFMVGSNIATRSAHKIDNTSAQYGALFAMSAIYSLLFAPMLYFVFRSENGSSNVVSAALITAVGFAALTAVAMTTRRDLSFLRPIIMWGFIVALGLIVVGVLFGFTLGPLFSLAMIGLTGASILYQTQNIVRQYPEWAYVGAAVGLFSSVMTMFWYVLQLFSRR